MISPIAGAIRLFNQPLVKEGIKNVAGSLTLAFGLVEIYDLYQIARGREISTEDYSAYPKWVQIANKVILISAKISLILSAGVSHPGVFILSTLAGCAFSTAQLDQVFGPNTLFAINPWHPRHVISIVAVALALPSVLQTTYKAFKASEKPLADSKTRLSALFNTLTSRPLLHIGNQLSRGLIFR